MFLDFESLQDSKRSDRIIFVMCCFAAMCIIGFLYFLVLSQRVKGYEFKNVIVPVPFFIILLDKVMLQPVHEEVMFRLALKFSLRNLICSFCAIAFYVLLDHERKYLFTSLGQHFELRLASAIICCTLFFILIRVQRVVESLASIWRRHRYVIIGVSLFFFTFIHIGRFKYDIGLTEFIILAWVLFSGIIFTYVRLKLGFLMGLIFHSIENAMPYVVVWLLTGKLH